MPKDDFYTPTDIDSLRMENELLAFEVRFLKARLAESERAAAQFEDRLKEARRAEEDLVLLLRRLGSSPFGRILRLRQGFRTLEQRYLGTDA